MRSLPLVLLAAGLSKRYGRLKQLDPLGPGGESIMDYNVFDAVRAGFDRVVIVTRAEIHDEVRAHVDALVGGAIPVDYVDQAVRISAGGYETPPDRAKPWGTGHAVLEAASALDGPFAVCNSDDRYGPGAFQLLHEHLMSEPIPTDAALVGYTLSETLSHSGGVSRALCTLRSGGTLARITEIQDVRRTDGWITGREVGGEPVELEDDATVSMNLWAFSPSVLELLERQFIRFLATWGADPVREFYLSTAVHGQVQLGATEVSVYHAPDRWFGVTHADEREHARKQIATAVDAGTYPKRLSEGFEALA